MSNSSPQLKRRPGPLAPLGQGLAYSRKGRCLGGTVLIYFVCSGRVRKTFDAGSLFKRFLKMNMKVELSWVLGCVAIFIEWSVIHIYSNMWYIVEKHSFTHSWRPCLTPTKNQLEQLNEQLKDFDGSYLSLEPPNHMGDQICLKICCFVGELFIQLYGACNKPLPGTL